MSVEDNPVEIYADGEKNDNCSAACVNCGSDAEGEAWTLTQSISCLVASGCVVLPPEDFDDVVASDTPVPKASELAVAKPQ